MIMKIQIISVLFILLNAGLPQAQSFDKSRADSLLNLLAEKDKAMGSIANSEKITIGNMLSHRSGIHSFTSDPAYPAYLTQSKTRQEMLEIITKTKPDFNPGDRMEYSNTFILEQGGGKFTFTKENEGN